MTKRMLIDARHPEEMRVVIADARQIYDFDFVTSAKKQVKGNIYLAKITRVEPSLQAAFVEYGGGKQGFLPFAEIHPDYYQIPVSDRRKLLEEAESGSAEETEDAPAPSSDTDYTPLAEDSVDAEVAAANFAPPPAVELLPEALAMPAEMPLEALPEAPAESPEETQPAQPEVAKLTFSASEIIAGESLENAGLAERLAQENAEAKNEGGEAGEGVETLPNEDEEVRPKRNFSKRYRIQEVIKRGQIVLVQVIKEERGNKGVSLTTFLSLAGRYCVLMPNSPKDGGVSRKINDADTRRRLKDMMTELKLARGMSVIIRTAGIDRTRAEIRRDFDYLVKLWNHIREDTLAATAPALIYEESDLIKRVIRDQYTSDIDELLVEGEAGYTSAHDFMKMLLPSHTPRVKHYRENMPLFYAYGVEDQLLSMHDPVVKLKSGGYIVLSPTEALISIDVNSGRSTGERNIEETATKTNLEAAAEVARQLRLRDLAGLIVIDFIDMFESRNRRAVERALKEALKTDRAKIQIGRISPFGLLEMSRQRLRPSVSESNMVSCPHCQGRGIVRSHESLSIQIVRALEKEAATGNWGALRLNTPETVALHLLNHKRHLLGSIEERYGVQIHVAIDHSLTSVAYTIEKTRRAQGQQRPQNNGLSPQESTEPRRGRGRRGRPDIAMDDAPLPEEAAETMDAREEDALPEDAQSASEESQNGNPRRRRRGRRGGRGRRGDDRTPQTEGANTQEPREPSADAAPEGQEREPRGSSARGGRRRWRGQEEKTDAADAAPPVQSFAPEPREEKVTPLPAFTRSPAIEQPAPQPIQAASAAISPPPAAPSTSRPEGAPPRRGWWQRIIELD